MRLTLATRILFIFCLLSAVRPAQCQVSDSARVSVLTVYPGKDIYTLWGHSALRIQDPVTQTDISYNYGTFDFRNPLSFIVRFAYGKLDYQLSLSYSGDFLAHSWHSEGRGVVEQQLNMTGEEIRLLYNYLSVNARPENRVYRYDFLFDNCATKILDALEHALQTPLIDSTSSEITFRRLIRPYLRNHPGLDLAINLAMGIPVDRNATLRQLSFLPIELQSLLQHIHTSSDVPLVAQTDTLFGSPVSPQPRHRFFLPTEIGWFLFFLASILFLRDFQSPRRRWFDLVLFGVTTLLGLMITFFWFVSLHEITRPNLNILWTWPLHMIPLFYSRQSWTATYWWSCAISAAVFALGTVWWAQYTPPAALPVSLAVLLRCIILAKVPRTGFEPVLPA